MVRFRSGRRLEVLSHDALGNRRRVQSPNFTLSALLQWERLLLIVQETVLEKLAEDYDRHSLEDRRSRAAYAAVRLKWQEFFKKLNFNKLVLRPLALKDFGEIVKRRTHTKKIGHEGRVAKTFHPSLACHGSNIFGCASSFCCTIAEDASYQKKRRRR